MVRGESTIPSVLDLVTMGRAPGTSGLSLSSIDSSGDVTNEGPLGEDVFDLRNTGVDVEALRACSASAGSCISVVSKDWHGGWCRRESTRWKSCSGVDAPLSVCVSSQAKESSLSVTALSEMSSLLSDPNTSPFSHGLLLMIWDPTSSLNEVCCLFGDDRLGPAERPLSWGSWLIGPMKQEDPGAEEACLS